MLILIAVTFFAITFFASCKNEPNNNPQCECTVKVHPYGSPCACPVAGTPACDCSEEIQRIFTDITFLGKTLILIDETNGATDLKARGIHGKIQDGVNSVDITDSIWVSKFNTVYANNDFVIVINSGPDYNYGYGVDGYKILLRENQLAGYNSTAVAGCISAAAEYDVPGHINE